MNRIDATFDKLRAAGRAALIPYITAGDPSLAATVPLMHALTSAGADVIELGVPFSDPMADGPVIQRASERALRHGFGLSEILRTVAEARKQTDVPLVLFSYFNPLFQFGIEKLADKAKDVGVDGILVTDLVPEEASEFASVLRAHELDMIFLVAPTSTDER